MTKGENLPGAFDAITKINANLCHISAVASLIISAEAYGGNPEYADEALPNVAEIIQQKADDANKAANVLWEAFRAQKAAVDALERQVSEITDAKELLSKRDRLRELLAGKTTKEKLHEILESDEGE